MEFVPDIQDDEIEISSRLITASAAASADSESGEENMVAVKYSHAIKQMCEQGNRGRNGGVRFGVGRSKDGVVEGLMRKMAVYDSDSGSGVGSSKKLAEDCFVPA